MYVSVSFSDFELINDFDPFAVREYETAVLVSTPIEEELSEDPIERNIVAGCFGFYLPDAPIDDTLLNSHEPCSEVDVVPAQHHDFRNPKSRM